MKTLTIVLSILVITGASAFAREGNPQSSVRVLSVKRDIFYFKVCQTFIGGSIEVYGEDGAMILSDKIQNHKVIIDFYFQEAGVYKIRIKKDDREISFDYNKSTPKPEVEVSLEEIPQVVIFQQI